MTDSPNRANLELLTFQFDVVTVDSQGDIITGEQRRASYFVEHLNTEIGLDLVFIPGGHFWMGSPDEKGDDSEHPQHPVTVPAFYMGKYLGLAEKA